MADPTIKFTGDPVTNFHQGIPAKDLSASDYAALDTDQRAVVRASAVYDYPAYRDAIKQDRAVADAPAPGAQADAAPAPEAEFAVPAPAPEPEATPPAEAGA